MMIDPWHLAALVEGVRLRLDPGARLSDRGAIFAAARHAMALYQWSSRPDNAQQAAINAAAAHLTMVAGRHSPLLGAAYAVHTWLDQGGERPPMRAALARYWVDRGVTARPCPLLTGAAALAAAVPWTHDIWVGHFLDAVAAEAADGLALLRLIERSWGHAAMPSPAGAAICMPPPRSTCWRPRPYCRPPRSLSCSALRSKTPFACSMGWSCRASSARSPTAQNAGSTGSPTSPRCARPPPRRSHPGRRPGRPGGAVIDLMDATAAEAMAPLAPAPPLPPRERRQFDFSAIDQLLDRTDQAIRRAQTVLEQHSKRTLPAG